MGTSRIDSGYKQDSLEVSRKSLGTSSMAMMPLGRVWDHQCDCKVSRKSLDNSM